jgi:beta-lactamase regulating signal transducer with metallopeptidase domain
METDWLAIAWTQTWQVTLLIACVAPLARWAMARRPPLAFLLWMLIFVKCLSPPLWSSPSGVFCWLQPPRVGDAGAWQSPSAPAAELVAVVVADEQPARAPVIRGVETLPLEDRSVFAWPWWIAATWGVGAGVVLAATVWQWRRFLKLSRPMAGEEILAHEATLAALARRLGLHRRVRLAISDARVGPAAVGLFRPCVIVPRAVLDGKSAAEAELIFAHELIHLRRGDGWFGLLRLATVAAWWFHPMVWWAGRQAARAAERCCDEAVLAELRCPPGRYARCLLDVLDRKRAMVYVPAFPGVRAMEVTRKRLEKIMKIGDRGYRRTPWWCWGVALLAAAAVLPGAALGISGEEERNDTKPLSPSASRATIPGAKRPRLASVPGSCPYHAPLGAGVAGPAKPDAPEAPTCSIVYKVDDVVSRIEKEQKLDWAESVVYLKRVLLCSASTPPVERVLQNGNLAIENGPNATIRWSKDGRLVVTTTEAKHKRIRDMLETMRKNGVAEMTIQMHFVSAPIEEIRRIVWTPLPPDVPADAVPNFDGGKATLSLGDRSFESNAGARPIRVQSIVEKVSPLLFKIVDKEAKRKTIDRWQADTRTNILQAPKITVFSGQSTCCFDCTWSPFVIALKEGQPQIRMISEGTVIQLRPILSAKGDLKLDFLVTLSKIRDVDTIALSRDAMGKPMKDPKSAAASVQVPEVATTRLEGTVDMPWGSLLLLYGGEVPQLRDQKQALCLAISVEKLTGLTP